MLKIGYNHARRAVRSLRKKTASQLFLLIISVIMPLVLAYVAVASKTDKFLATFATVKVSTTDPKLYEVEISAIFVYSVTFIFLSLILITIISLFKSINDTSRYTLIVKKARKERDKKIEYNKALRSAYDLIGREATRLHSQLFSNDNSIGYNYKSIHTKYIIREDGTTKVEKTFVIEAGPRPVIKFQFYIDAQPNGTHSLLYTDIKFKVDSLDEKLNVAFIPMRDSYQYKDFLVLLLPQLEPHKTRSIRIEYEWPKFFSGLIRTGQDDLYWDNKGYNRDKKTEFLSEFYFDKQIGKIEARMIGISTNNTEITTEDRENEYYVKLNVPDLPIDVSNYQISFTKK